MEPWVWDDGYQGCVTFKVRCSDIIFVRLDAFCPQVDVVSPFLSLSLIDALMGILMDVWRGK